MSAIVICEPQCAGFEHAPHNAALLATAARAFPGHPLHFLAEATHIEAVRELLGGCAAYSDIPLHETAVRVPDRVAGAFRVFEGEGRAHLIALRHALKAEADLVLFASVSEPGLLALQMLLRLQRKRPPVLAILHGLLANLGHPPRSMAKRLAGVHRSLNTELLDGVRFIALGGPILEQLHTTAPRAARHFLTMDHPYLWSAAHGKPDAPGEPPCFGYLGVANRYKGFDRFVRVAKEARARGAEARFLLAGFVPEGTPTEGAEGIVDGLGHAPLSREEYAARIQRMDFVLWTGEPDHYRLTASGSFLDALSFVKPGIYLSNPYIAHYAAAMGDIGEVRATEEALVDAVCAPRDPARYAAQCEAILAGRRLFEPETLAPRLREIAAECGFGGG